MNYSAIEPATLLFYTDEKTNINQTIVQDLSQRTNINKTISSKTDAPVDKFKSMLDNFGSFPPTYRLLTWK